MGDLRKEHQEEEAHQTINLGDTATPLNLQKSKGKATAAETAPKPPTSARGFGGGKVGVEASSKVLQYRSRSEVQYDDPES